MNKSSTFTLSILVNFLFVSSAFGQEMTNPKFNKVVSSLVSKSEAPTIDINEFKSVLAKNNVLVLDAREKEEFEISHIKNAINIGYDNFDLEKVSKKLDKTKPIIIYCSVGYRSGQLAEKLIEKGFKVKNLYGGIFEWKNQGNDVFDKSSNKTQRVHTYNKKWSKWLKLGEAVY